MELGKEYVFVEELANGDKSLISNSSSCSLMNFCIFFECCSTGMLTTSYNGRMEVYVNLVDFVFKFHQNISILDTTARII